MNKNNKTQQLVIMSMSGIYEGSDLLKEPSTYLDLTDISGTNCYCDEEAAFLISQKIKPFPVAGIHLIDSGNYHYLSKFWLARMEEPFQLLMLDNHTDMQPPAFGGLLSCGGWLQSSLEELPLLKKVSLVGPDEASYEPVRDSRVSFHSRERLNDERERGAVESLFEQIAAELDPNLPLYISIDKDVLNGDYATTTWSQGDMTVEELKALLGRVYARLKACGLPVLGVDLCGTCDIENTDDNQQNEIVDQELIHFLQER